MGWLFDRAGIAEHRRYARDVYEDRGMRVIHSTFGLWVLSGILLPFGLGYLIDGTLAGALTGALWGGRVLPRLNVGALRILFVIILVLIAIEMGWRALANL